MKPVEYRGLLWVFAAGILGISLLCSVSGMAIQDLNVATAMALQPGEVVESFVENLNTVAAQTLEAFSELAATSTPTPPARATDTTMPTILTVTASRTPVVFRFPTVIEPTQTRRPRPDPTSTRIPTRTPTRVPTRTPTRTPVPPTNTPPPTFTDTPLPPPTATNTPLPTSTSVPPTTQAPASPTPGTPASGGSTPAASGATPTAGATATP
ncbi:MAG TPA: hypothetical protein VJ821_10790 [Anaerolineales bacterium]|nr:hypothetical protein [Anaerolineales bacterium]